MRLRLEPPQVAGRNAVAALVRQEVGVRTLGPDAAPCIVGHGRLEPVAYLCLIDGVETALDAQGEPMRTEEIETLLPGAWDSFRQAVIASKLPF